MRKLLLFLVLVALIAGAIVVYFVATTPRAAEGIRFPLSTSHRALLSIVPADARTFALVPTAAAVHARLQENPVTRDPVAAWTHQVQLPPPWMLGSADLITWQSPAGQSYGFRLDPVRAFFVRAYLQFTGAELRSEGATFLVGAPASGERLAESEIAAILELTRGMSGGDALIVQREDARMFPPVGRPAISTVTVAPREISIASRARSTSTASRAAQSVTLPRSALLSAWFGEPPRLVSDLDRLLPGKVSTLLGDGGSVVLYDVESRRLLPRPKGVFVVADTPEARSSVNRLTGVAEMFGGVEYRDGSILIAVDRSSLGEYRAEQFEDLPFPATEWALRLDADRMVPLLERLGDHRGLRLATPRLYRSLRDLRRWIGHLRGVDTIEAALADQQAARELRVRVTAK